MQAALNGTPFASAGLAERPPLRWWRGSTPPMRAETSGLVTTSSIFSEGSPSTFIATAVARTSMCPISSVPVCNSMSRGSGRRRMDEVGSAAYPHPQRA
jgi:hypothetical protein